MTKKMSQRYYGAPSCKNEIEREAWNTQNFVCGIDEVGRGCLAGPLVTAAVILPINKTNPLLRDSKVLTVESRVRGAAWIMRHCWYACGIVDHYLIDKYNIWNATLIAMKKAFVHLVALSPRPSRVLVDAMPLKLDDTHYADIPVHNFPHGESQSSSIAAASIIAKVKRDALMADFNAIFPGLYLDHNKGYSTPAHKRFLADHVKIIIHRNTFLNFLETCDDGGGSDNDAHNKQQSLC